MKTKKQIPVIKQDWLESERGWGTRPDGFSLHKSTEDLEAFVKEYWKDMPDRVPREYSRPCGEPYVVYVDSETYEQIGKSKYGLRRY